MAIPHAMCSGMGGMRTSGDLVARMQMTRGMKTVEAKAFVAGKLGISTAELTDAVIMRELREDLSLGTIRSFGGFPKGIEVKHHIADLLGVDINSLNIFRNRAGVM
ncbi:MAG: hypothetical protein K9L30_17650 [Desulfobacterales bacterium]|nr:hypothetical protein [Desulfobacterales bacterium]